MRASRILGLLGLVAWGALAVAVWRNAHLIGRAGETEDLGTRIARLESAARSFPLDHRAPLELGRARFDSAFQGLGDGARAAADLRLSAADLRRSIRLDPYSPFAHFQLGQSLLYLAEAAPGEGQGWLDEFRKAVSLMDYNSQFLLEIGRACLMRWDSLSGDDRAFAQGVLKKLLGKRDPDLALIAFQTWVMSSNDLAIIRNALPEDPRLQRAYAGFLASRSMSASERQLYLAKAEHLEFLAAVDELRSAEASLSVSSLERASELLRSCLGRLRGIRFYQDLRREALIDPQAYRTILRSCWLDLAKCGIEAGQALKDVLPDLENYLALESDAAPLDALAAYLEAHRLGQGTGPADADEPETAAFRLELLYKRNRTSDIIPWGRSFRALTIPETKKRAAVPIFQTLGDASRQAGDLADARDCYRLAWELDPHDIGTLLRMRSNAEALNDEAGAREANELIRRSVAPPDIIRAPSPVGKGDDAPFWRLRLEGRPITLELEFAGLSSEPFPLVSIVLDDRVVWEGYVERETQTVPLEPAAGENRLEISCLNRAVTLNKLSYR